MTTITRQKRRNMPVNTDREQRKAALAAARGSLAWVRYSADDYLREKREEVKRETME